MCHQLPLRKCFGTRLTGHFFSFHFLLCSRCSLPPNKYNYYANQPFIIKKACQSPVNQRKMLVFIVMLRMTLPPSALQLFISVICLLMNCFWTCEVKCSRTSKDQIPIVHQKCFRCSFNSFVLFLQIFIFYRSQSLAFLSRHKLCNYRLIVYHYIRI